VVAEREGVVIRRALLARFPHAILYVEMPAEIRVVAFAHLRPRPGYWLHRVP